jgi:ABC-type branched-subunit amino acid transport system substrate-binding protein
VGFTRKTLFSGLLVVLVISTSIIVLAKVEAREHYAYYIISINAAIAALLAIFIIYRQKHHHGSFEKADLALGIALSLSLCAHIVWGVYETNLGVVPPVPSLADLLSISAYAFLAFYVFSVYLRFHKIFHFNPKQLIVAVIISGIFLFYIISVTISLADFSSPRGVSMFSVIVAYPILDAIIMVPSFLIVINYRKEPLWFTPWVCKSAGIFLLAVADSWFAFFVVTSLTNELWPSSMVISAHNVIVAAGLLWYVKFLATHKDVDSNVILNQNASNRDNLDNKLEDAKIHKPKKSEKSRIRYFVLILVVGVSVSATIILTSSAIALSPLIWPPTFFPSLSSDTNKGLTQISNSDDLVRIGALLPLTGVASSTGKSTEAALNMALEDVNAKFSIGNSSLRYELVMEDTESDPTKSLEKLEHLANQGIKVVIGPATSAELQAVKDYADNNDILLISYSSTAPSLAIEGDNVFRFVPDDTNQAEAVSRLLWGDGIRIVIPFWRDDVYGNELMNAVRESFQKLGGKFDIGNGTRYEPRIGQLAASLHRINFVLWDKDLRLLDEKVQQVISEYDADKVGVYMVSLDEVSPIFIQAHSHPALTKVKWYGSDGSVLNEGLVRNHDSAHFAVNTSFYNPIYSINSEENEKLDHFEEEIYKEIEIDPSPYSAVAYDIFWVAAITLNETRSMWDQISSTNGNAEIQSINLIKETLLRSAISYHGVTGNITLNKMGDREGGDYDFWAVTSNEENDEIPFIWQKVGRYIGNGTGMVE